MQDILAKLPFWPRYRQLRAEYEAKFPHRADLPAGEERQLWRDFLGVAPDPPPNCPTCQDSRWVSVKDYDSDGDLRGDHMALCPACQGKTWEAERTRQLSLASGVPRAHAGDNFENWTPVEGADEALNAAWLLAKGETDYKLLLLYGGVGNGKSHLGYAAVNLAVQRGIQAQFWYVPALFAEWRKRMAETGAADTFLDGVQALPFLVLDDVGVEQGTAAQQSNLEAIINYRYAQELPLIVTTNRNPATLGGPVMSRFKDQRLSRMVFNSAPDWRR